MPISGSAPSKIYSRQIGAYTGSDAWAQLDAAAIPIRSSDQDTQANDLADALNAMLMKDGGNFATDMDINGNKFLDCEDAAARNQFASAGQVQDSSLVYVAAGGTGDAITLDLTPSITAYAAGQTFHFKASATNTGAATINVDSVGAKDIKKGAAGSTALAAGDITSGGMYTVQYDGTNFQLINPGISDFAASILNDADAAAVRTTISAQASDALLTSIAGLTFAADSYIYGTGSDTAAAGTITTFGRSLVDDATAAAARTTLGATLTDAIFPGALIAIIEDQKSSGTSSGTASTGTDQVRTLNTLVYNRNTTVSLSSNQFTLPAGSYEIRWSTPAHQCDRHQSILRDATGGADLARGTSEAAINNTTPTRSFGVFRHSPSGSNTYEIRHRVETAGTLGQACSFGTEVYTRVEIYAA